MLEPCDAKVSSMVLRGLGDRKVARLLGSLKYVWKAANQCIVHTAKTAPVGLVGLKVIGSVQESEQPRDSSGSSALAFIVPAAAVAG